MLETYLKQITYYKVNVNGLMLRSRKVLEGILCSPISRGLCDTFDAMPTEQFAAAPE